MKTRAECLEKYGSDYFIEKKIEEGELFKVGKGIYSEKKICSGNCNVRIQISECGSNDEKCFLLSWINGHDT